MGEVLLGSTQPRIFTPPLRELTRETSWGFDVIWFARVILRKPLTPWQEWLAVHSLELLDDGTPRFKTIVLLVARQNGKTHFAKVLIMWALFRKRLKFVLGAAQTKNDAKELWDEILLECEENPSLKRRMKRPNFTNGSEALKTKWGVYKIAALDRKAGRGKTVNLLFMDELREHKTWEGWSALSSTTLSPQIGINFACSNAGDARSVVLRSIRDKSLEAIAVGKSDVTVGLFEWSADPDLDIDDRIGWAQANPDLGYGRLSERDLMAEREAKDDAEFKTENLCQWVDILAPSKFPAGTWEACLDPGSRRAPGVDVAVGLDVAVDMKAAHVVVAAKRADGLWHVEVVASRPGIDWVLGWFEQRRGADWFDGRIALQARGAPASALIQRLQEAEFDVVEWQGSELTQGTLSFYDLVVQKKIRHRGQPVLDAAATGAQDRRAGDAFMWDRSKSVGDVSPIVAATAAVWLASQPKAVPRKSVYEDMDLMVL